MRIRPRIRSLRRQPIPPGADPRAGAHAQAADAARTDES
jgi:hypothetical protein